MKRTASIRGEKGKDQENGDVIEVDPELEDVREVDLRWGVERDHAREDNDWMYLIT